MFGNILSLKRFNNSGHIYNIRRKGRTLLKRKFYENSEKLFKLGPNFSLIFSLQYSEKDKLQAEEGVYTAKLETKYRICQT